MFVVCENCAIKLESYLNIGKLLTLSYFRDLVGVGLATIRLPKSWRLQLARIKTFLKLQQVLCELFDQGISLDLKKSLIKAFNYKRNWTIFLGGGAGVVYFAFKSL